MKNLSFIAQTWKILSSIVLFFLLLLFQPYHSNAQDGYSNASYARGKMYSDNRFIPSPDEVVIEEYLNYHRHDLPSPSDKESVRMDIGWGNQQGFLVGNEAILQIGFTTAKKENINDAPLLNLCLVIDKSGSMNGDRIAKAREACLKVIERLRPKDIVSIVLFNHEACILLPATKRGDGKNISNIIESIQADGSTDLNSGLLLGYKEVIKNYQAAYTNKVILLTDALTNTGTVDPEQIIKNSDSYRKEISIGFTIVGVGVDFNENLSRKLAGSQNNSIHFINDAEDIKKVFADEIESLLSPIAEKVELEIQFSEGLMVDQVYGYEPVFESNKIRIRLDNMNSGLTQVILIKFKNISSNKAFNINAKLQYRDLRKKKEDEIEKSLSLRNENYNGDVLTDKKIKKNYYIAFIASGIKDMAQAYKDKNIPKAKTIVSFTLDNVRKQYGESIADTDIKRVFDILVKYESDIHQLSQK
jgi:Ca-activated chloride channel family protein